MTNTLGATTAQPARMRRIAAASFIGTTLEWYDYYLFGTAAALVFGYTYFVAESAVAGALASFATFAVGFVVRPLGAIIFGHIGDRVGRKRSLLITIVLMGAVTGAVGILPDFSVIGIWAPVLLVVLRIIQGLAMGGEWSGASTLITEHADRKRRGFFAMLPQLGNPLGILIGVLLFTLISNVLAEEEFIAWGWRIPFLLAIPFSLVALWIRSSIPESLPSEVQQRAESIPFIEIVRAYKIPVALGIGVSILGTAGYYFADTFMLNHGTGVLGLDYSTLLKASLITAVINIPLFLAWGLLANRIGGFRVAIIGAIVSLALTYPMFALVGMATGLTVSLAMIIGGSMVSISFAASGQILNEIFPARVRQSGVGLSYNLAATVAGFVPLIATFVMNITGGNVWITGSLLALLGAVTLLSTLAAQSRRLEIDA